MFKKSNKKAFTLIELIVIMAVIAILVLLSIPKLIGYTQKAHLTEIKSNIKQLETASERYYIDKQDWPRLSDTPYTADQLETFAQEIKDKTGAIITLETEGKYYEIDYDKLQKYVQKPKDDVHYILQNPIGEVFYLEDLTEEGKTILYREQKQSEINHKPTAVISMSPDKELTTTTTITWSYANSIDIDGDAIINAEWQGKQDIYTAQGTYTVKLRVQDENGEWSDWTSKTFDIKEEEIINRTSFDLSQGLAYFNGNISDYIIKKPLNFPTTSITAEFWVKTTDSSDGIMSYAVSNSFNEFLIYSSNAIEIYINDAYVRTGVKINDGLWHHLAVTWDSTSGSMKLYKDGALAYQSIISKGIPLQSGGSMTLGQEQDSVGGSFESLQSFKGYLDEVRIWNRVLTQEEINANMNYSLTGQIPSLMLYYNFNQAPTNNIIVDETRNNNDGLLYGNVKVGISEIVQLANNYANFTGSVSNYLVKYPFTNMPTTDITAELRIKTTDSGDGILSYAVSNSFNEFLIFSSNALEIHINSTLVNTGVRINDGLWHNLAVTWSASTGRLIVYVDGVSKYSGVISKGTPISNNGALIFGQEQDSLNGGFAASQSFNGSLDDIRIWSRVLTQQEINDNINGNFLEGATGLVLNYDFEDVLSNKIPDKTGNGNDATIVGTISITK